MSFSMASKEIRTLGLLVLKPQHIEVFLGALYELCGLHGDRETLLVLLLLLIEGFPN